MDLNWTLALNLTFQNWSLEPDPNTIKDEVLVDDIAATVLTSAVLALLILATVVGNVFVIAAIFLERNLQSVGNFLVLSLAVADLMVACLVMPLGAVYEVSHAWHLGAELCDTWTLFDVLCCTASILHLLAIALDRFWAVTNVDYIRQRSARNVGVMIFLVWAVAFAVSIAPIFGWKDPDFRRRIEDERRCLISQDAAYQVFATCSSFYVPLILILLLYWRIYQVARKRIRHKPGAKSRPRLQVSAPVSPSAELTMVTVATSSSQHSDVALISNNSNGCQQQPPPQHERKKRTKESIESKRERKAAKTLAIITGIFVMCWLPFFVTALVMPFCPSCEPSGTLFSFFLWLGYANSMLNPIIYTIFSPDFRSAFKKMFTGRRNW